MGKLSKKIRNLEYQINALKSKIKNLSRDTEEKEIKPFSKVGGIRDRSHIRPTDISTALAQMYGGNIPWNDSELVLPPYGIQPATPEKGYHKHSHSEYSGGALDVNTLKLVEYETDNDGDIVNISGNKLNKHCQQFWLDDPRIEVSQNDDEENIGKIGLVDFTFDANTGKWKVKPSEIDVEETYLVKRDENGDIELDNNGNEKKAPLYNSDASKSNVVWDETNQVWRFYAIYSDE